MAERYTKLSFIEENQYCIGSPILIQAGSLLKDNETGKVLGQFKFMNLTNKTIKALLVKVDAFDISGRQVAGVYEFQYLDLFAERNVSFGQKTAVPLPDVVTRSIQVHCLSVVFDDGSTWNADENAIWNPLPRQQCLYDILEFQLVEQYKRETCRNADYVLLEHEDLWLCACGEINHKDEEQCYCCKNVKADLIAALSEEELTQHSIEHLAEQQAIAEAESIKNAERAQKTKKRVIIGSIVAVAVFVILLFTVILPAQRTAEQRETINAFKADARNKVYDALTNQLYMSFADSQNGVRAILNTMEITYEDEVIEDDEFSLIASYRVQVNDDYYVTYRYKISGSFSTGSGSLEYLDLEVSEVEYVRPKITVELD